MIGYMGAALMTNHVPVETAHKLVYAEVHRLPENIQRHLVGLDSNSVDPTEHASQRARAEHVDIFAQFLPWFAIRPLYNQLLFLTSRILGLTRSAVLLALFPYFLLSLLVFRWTCRYIRPEFAASFSLLLMLTVPIAGVGRTPVSDALSVLIATIVLYLLFERDQTAVGITLLLASIFARTDNVALAMPVLAVLWLTKRISFLQASILGVIAVSSVLFISRMAGDFGLQMLYYRNFVAIPVAPGEVVVHFSLAQYLRAFRAGLAAMLQGWLVPFLLLASIGLFRGSRLRVLSGIAVVYVALHFLILPNWMERWFVVAYIPMALSAVCVAGNHYEMLYKSVFQGLPRPQSPTP